MLSEIGVLSYVFAPGPWVGESRDSSRGSAGKNYRSNSQKTVPGRVRVNFAQNGGHEKATKKPRKRPRHCFSRQKRATKKPRKSQEKATRRDSGGWTTELAQGALSNPQVRPEVLRWLHGLAICLDPFSGRQGLTHGGGGVRPILIGMVWTKLVSHLLLAQARPDLEPFLKGKQFGIGTPQGGLAMTLSIRARLAANPTHVIASLDFKNAFVARAWTLCEDSVHIAQPTVINNPTGDKPSKTWDGLPQGDPLSTLLFSSVMSEVVSQAVRTITSEVHVVSYVDDTILTGPAEDVTQVLQQLPKLLQPSGLELQPAKTQVWAPYSECLRHTPLLRDLRAKMSERPPGSHQSHHCGRGHGQSLHRLLPCRR